LGDRSIPDTRPWLRRCQRRPANRSPPPATFPTCRSPQSSTSVYPDAPRARLAMEEFQLRLREGIRHEVGRRNLAGIVYRSGAYREQGGLGLAHVKPLWKTEVCHCMVKLKMQGHGARLQGHCCPGCKACAKRMQRPCAGCKGLGCRLLQQGLWTGCNRPVQSARPVQGLGQGLCRLGTKAHCSGGGRLGLRRFYAE